MSSNGQQEDVYRPEGGELVFSASLVEIDEITGDASGGGPSDVSALIAKAVMAKALDSRDLRAIVESIEWADEGKYDLAIEPLDESAALD